MSDKEQSDRYRVTVPTLKKWRAEGRKIVVTTAYDAVTAAIADPVVDVILVGDSLGNVVLGFENTLPVTMAMMNHHLEAVARTQPRALVVADLPFLSYNLGLTETLRNAGGFIQRGAAAVKLEGGVKRLEVVRGLIDAEIPVMGHIGLTPQSIHVMGGYRVQGRAAADANRILEDAKRLQDAGCFAIVLEGIPAELAARVTDALGIPTIGIGAGPYCSGQVLVFHDIVGLSRGPKPKFVRSYADGFDVLQSALARWADDVRNGAFPSTAESYTQPKETSLPVAQLGGARDKSS